MEQNNLQQDLDKYFIVEGGFGNYDIKERKFSSCETNSHQSQEW